MQVRLLGELTVTGSHGQVSGGRLASRRSRLLIAALALADRPLTPEALADVLWPEDRPATWDVALRGAIRALRQTLRDVGPEATDLIRHTPTGYVLGAPAADVDVTGLDSTLHEAVAALAAGNPAASGTLHDLATCRGHQLLPDDDADWIDRHRRHIDEIALVANQRLVELAADDQMPRVLASARRAAEEFTLDERAHRVFMRALSRAGDRAGLVTAFEQCRTLLADLLGVDPSPDTISVYLDALGEQAPSRALKAPSWPGSFVGRDDECAVVAEALRSTRPVTVTGSGGVGKSRLVATVIQSADIRARFPGGLAWVSLSAVADDQLVASTIAREIGVAPAAVDVESALTAELAPLGPFLLILDGCEQVVDGAASLVAVLRSGAPLLHILATGRVPLGVDDECVVPVTALSAADDDRHATSLLLQRVRDAGGELTIDDDTRPLIAAVLNRCGGLPLAIELAAAQLADLSLADLLDHLDTTTGEPLAAMISGSYQLLDTEAATVFRRLSVLDGEVTLPVIRAVVTDEHVAPVRVVRILRELTVRGLLAVDKSGARWFYRQDDDVRRVAAALLAVGDERSAAFHRLGLMLRSLLPDDPRALPSSYQAEMSAAIGPLRAFLAAALEGDASVEQALEIAYRLHRYWAATSVSEGRFWLSRLLAMPGRSGWQGYAEYALGYLGYWAGDTAGGAELSTAVASLRGVDDAYAARALIFLAGLYDDADRGAAGIERVREAIELSRPYGVDLQVSASMGLACLLAERGDGEAERYAADAIALCRDGGSADQLAATLPTAAMCCWQVGAAQAAAAYIAEARPLLGDARRIARVVMLSVAAGLALMDEDPDLAASTAALADAEATAMGVDREITLIRCLHARALLRLGDVPAAAVACDSAFEAATRLSVVSPLANCFETAALVVGEAAARSLLAAAQSIRLRGDRPTPTPLAEDVDVARIAAGIDGVPVGVEILDLAARARQELRVLSATADQPAVR